MQRVATWFWNYKRNNGDAIATHIFARVIGVEPVFADRDSDHVLSIGSVIAHATPRSHIWGSGVLDHKDKQVAIDPAKVHAVRGRLTLQWLRDRGLAIGDVPVGDPGIFADRLVPENPAPPVRLAVVPHHDDAAGLTARFAGRDDVRVVSMIDDGLAPLAQLAGAEAIAAESLHGLVYAEALGIPSVWIAARRDSLWRFKFRDWYSTTAEPQDEPLPPDADPAQLVAAARLAGSRIDRAALLAAFPHGAAPGRDGPLIGFEQCRAIGVLTASLGSPLFESLRAAESFDDAEIEALQWRIVAAMRELLAGWAQPIYLCLHHGPPPPPERVHAATAHLDRTTRSEFALIRPRAPGDPDSEIDTEGRRLGGALVIRPVCWFSPKKPFATVFTP